MVELTITFGKEQETIIDHLIERAKSHEEIISSEKIEHMMDYLKQVTYTIKFKNAYCLYLFGHAQGSMKMKDIFKRL